MVMGMIPLIATLIEVAVTKVETIIQKIRGGAKPTSQIKAKNKKTALETVPFWFHTRRRLGS